MEGALNSVGSIKGQKVDEVELVEKQAAVTCMSIHFDRFDLLDSFDIRFTTAEKSGPTRA
jgi:hypothetical protein